MTAGLKLGLAAPWGGSVLAPQQRGKASVWRSPEPTLRTLARAHGGSVGMVIYTRVIYQILYS